MTTAQLYFGGDIITMDGSNPLAEAVAVMDGKIIGVGSKSYCQSKLNVTPQEINLGNKTLLPGFIDTHIHPTLMILYEMYEDMSDLKSMQELKQRMKGMAASKSDSDWVMGLQFEEQYFDQPQLPTRHDLDECCPDRPAFLIKRDGHSLFANTKAIEAADVTSNTADPDGGAIMREGDGYPSGQFSESAMDMIMSKLPFPEMDTIIEASRAVFKRITGHGVTSASVILQTGEDGPLGSQGAFDIPLMEMVIDQVPIAMNSLLVADKAETILGLKDSVLNRQNEGRGHRISGLKFWADGSFASCSAKMKEPFNDRPDTCGFLLEDPDRIYERIRDAHTAGLQVAVHAIGDETNRICTELFEKVLKEHPRSDHRHRIEHASTVDEPTMQAFARLNLIASVQPLFIHSEKSWIYRRIGEERAKQTYAFRSFLDHGVILSGSSDCPIESMDVMLAIQSCVNRPEFEPQQSITIGEALSMFTCNAAWAQFEEQVKGSITEGKKADFVVLGENPTKVPENEIAGIGIEQTICDGVVR